MNWIIVSVSLLLTWTTITAGQSTDQTSLQDDYSTTEQLFESTTASERPHKPQNLKAYSGGSTSLTISWDKATEGDVDAYEIAYANQNVQVKEIVNQSKCTLTNLQPWTSYSISVRSLRFVGNDTVYSEPALLIVQTSRSEPSVPRNFTASGQNYTSINLSWNQPSEWNGEPVGYDLWLNNESGSDVFSIRLKGKDNRMFKITALKPSTKYTVHLRAVSQVSGEEVQGQIVWLDALTSKAGPPSAPQNFTTTGQEYTSISLSWNKPAEWNGEPVGYDLWINTENGSDIFFIRLKGEDNQKFGVTDLMAGTNYTLNLRAVSQVSGQEYDGETVLLVAQTSPVGPPSVVRNLKVERHFPTNLTLSWDQPEEWSGPPHGYKVLILGQGSSTSYLYGKDRTRFIYKGEHDENLAAYVSAFVTNNGEDIFGQPATLYIPSYSSRAPSPPRNIRVLYDAFGNPVLTWDQPLDWNGLEGGYLITYTDEVGVSMMFKLKGEDNTEFRPVGLKPDYHYNFSFTSYNIISGEEKDSTTVDLVVRTFPPDRPHKPLNLKVDSAGPTTLAISWDKALQADVDAYEVTHLVQNTEVKDNVQENNITLTNLQPWLNYYISVRSMHFVSNSTVFSEPAWLTAQTTYSVPSPPVSPTVVAASGSSVTLKWSTPLLPNGPLEGYVVSWSDGEGEASSTTCVKTTCTIESLKPWTTYDFNITAYNSPSKPELISDPAKITTRTDVSAPGVVGSLVIYNVSDSSLTAKWIKPKTANGPVSGYRVTFANTESGDSENFTTSANNCFLQKLKPWSTYSVSVEAYNTLERDVHTNLFGPAATETQKTKVGWPSAPKNLTTEKVTNTTIEVTWERPEEPNGPISGYFVRDFNRSNAGYVVNDTSFTLENLTPWTNYTVSVVAFNDAGKTQNPSPAATIEERTSASVPPYTSTKLSIGSTEKESATLKFPLNLFSNQYGDIVEYVLLVAASKSKSNTQDQGFQSLNETSFPNWKDTMNTEQWYRSSHINWNIDTDSTICSADGTSTRKCVIGNDKTCNDANKYCDAPLTPDTQYWAKIRAYTVAGWTETFPVTFKTAGAVKPTIGVSVLLIMSAIRILV